MIEEYKNRYVRLILVNIIILSSLLFSCAGMRPPGYHQGMYKSKKIDKKITSVDTKQNENINDENVTVIDADDQFDLSKIKEFEEKVVEAKNSNIIESEEVIAGEEPKVTIVSENHPFENNDFSDKLKTLDEQMLDISDVQQQTSDRVDKLEKNVASIEKRLKNIENKLEDTKYVKPVKSKKESIPSKSKGSFIIQPDEKVNNSKKVNVTYTKPKPAIEEQKQSLNIDEKTKDQFEAGINFFNAGKYSLAIKTLKDVDINDNSDLYNPVNYYVAKSYFENKDYPNTLNHLENVIRSKTGNYKPEAQILMAETYIISGKANMAKEIYRSFVSNYPTNKHTPEARKMLQKL